MYLKATPSSLDTCRAFLPCQICQISKTYFVEKSMVCPNMPFEMVIIKVISYGNEKLGLAMGLTLQNVGDIKGRISYNMPNPSSLPYNVKL